MPKKGKGKGKGKGKAAKAASAVIDGVSTDDMTTEQLQEHVVRLRDEVDKERAERNFFQLERDKVNSFWEISQRQLEEANATMRNKERELEDAEERHQVEIKVYKQKVKHLLYEHQNNITELKRDGAVAMTLEEEQHRQHEGDVRQEKRTLKVELKEMELAHQDATKALKMEHDKAVTAMREEFEQMATELQAKHEKKMVAQRDELELRRKAEIHEVEERKNGQINTLMKNHEKAFSDIKNYYNDITLNNLALINSLKEQLEKMKKDQDKLEKQLAETQAENRRLQDPLQKAREELAELHKQLSSYERDKVSLANAKARLKVQESELKSLRWEHEVLEQRFAQVQQERDELYTRFTKAIHEVQQKSGLKNLLLEKKLSTLTDTLEKKVT
ncbi:Dynein regulatory complex subunit 4 [Geodia barretti]|uniref:Dynein regulatory complex subunit 4 n=1 Tax=Geodia barretti TaxID=519541 RepID=A0AA35VV04_GEOBA|nr:Dynein regulatory complex subunit 4 [Geodia barretti]